MLTTPWDQPSPGTACITWCLGNNCTCPLTFISPQLWAKKTPVCQSLHCWLTWVTVRSLQRSASTVLIWGWKAEVILWLQGQCHFTGTRQPGPSKSWCLQREEKGQRPVGGGTVWSGTPDCRRHPFIPREKPADQMLVRPPLELTSSHHPHNGSSFMYQCMSWPDKVHHHHPGGTYAESEWEWESATECKMSVTGPALDRWDSSTTGQ